MEQELERMKKKVGEKKAERQYLTIEAGSLNSKIFYLENRQTNGEKARVLLQEIAKQTQQQLEFHISNLVTMALAAVFPQPPKLTARIEIRRNKTECDLLFSEFDTENKPIDSSGGGVLDVASFALRVSFWALRRNRPVFILDEPFRNVSPNLQHKVSEMLKMVSKKLGVQIIMVSHAEEINVAADRTFTVEKKGKISLVKEA